MTFLIVSGTGTDVGKTVVTAAVAANASRAGRRVAIVKPAQTGVSATQDGDLQEVTRLTALQTTYEYARFPDPLAPAAAARIRGLPELDLKSHVADLHTLNDAYDLVLVEGAGGLLVRFDDAPTTIADLAGWLDAPVLIVVRPALGTLNHTELTLKYLEGRNLDCAGLVIGAWPAQPDLAMRCNLRDLEVMSGTPLRGALPDNAASHEVDAFRDVALASLDPALYGKFDAGLFRSTHDPGLGEEVK